MGRCCCVPGCKSNYHSSKGGTVSTFSFPRDEERREKWLRSIRRDNFVPGKCAYVCIKHFSENHVIRVDTAKRPDGSILTVPRTIPKLTDDAFPTIFAGHPSYMSKPTPATRKTPEGRRQEALQKDEMDLKAWCEKVKILNYEDLLGTPFTKNSWNQYEHFDIKDEEDPLSVTEIKIEPEDSICEIKTEAEESDICFEDIDVKHENEPSSQLNLTNTVSEVEGTQENFRIWEDYEKNSQNVQKNTEEDPVVFDRCVTYGTVLQEHACVDYTGEKANRYSIHHPSVLVLNEHSYTRNIDERVECNICSKSFSQKSYLIIHKRTHANEKLFKCCDICRKSFFRKSDLINHIRTHTNEKPFKCIICSKSFSQKSNLGAHTRTHTIEKPFKCAFCCISFPYRHTFMEHVHTFHKGERPYKCYICSESFSQKSDLTAHKRAHEKPFKCNFCRKSFSHKSKLNTHRRIHTDVKPFKCNACSKSFSQKSNLTTHTRTHTNEKPFKCTFCAKSFHQKRTLTEHIHTHTNERPFKCYICSKSFSHKSTLSAHNHTHKTVKPFKCKICRDSFSHSSSLKMHMHIHTNERLFKCNICRKSFCKKSVLISHLGTHTKEKRFKCHICRKSFCKKSVLTSHMGTHIEEKQFKCNICC